MITDDKNKKMTLKKKKIAVLTSGWSIDYVRAVLKGIESVTKDENVDLYVFVCYKFIDQKNTENFTSYNIVSIIDYKEFDAIVFLSNIIEDQALLKEEAKKIKKLGIPAVSLLAPLDGFDYIDNDDAPGFRNLLQHMKDVHNCTDFAFIGGPENAKESQIRYETFMEFIKENNLKIKEDRLFLNGDYRPAFAENAAVKMLKNKTKIPDVIVCVNDYSALSVITYASHHKINVPEDLKVIGFDNISYARKSDPSISTCDPQHFEIGKTAGLKILSKLNNKSKKITFPSKMILGQSCGCDICSDDQKDSFIEYYYSNDEAENFNSQMRHMEDLFLTNTDSHNLINELGAFFEKRHYFEGSDFAMMLQKDYVKSFLNSSTPYEPVSTIKDNVISVVHIVNNQKIKPCLFDAKEIVPPYFEDEHNSVFYIYPLVAVDALIGYAISKNSDKLLEGKRGYQWIRNLCNHFENFKQKCSYKILSEKYLELSTKDALSGALNRLGYNTFAAKTFDSNKKKNLSSIIIFIDINSMKQINDKFGHLQGDFAIKIVAESVRNVMPKGWLSVRYGGDEFVIIGQGDKTEGQKFCDDFAANLKENSETLKLPYQVTASTGFKCFSPKTKYSLDEAVSIVDEIMYKNKKAFHKTRGD